MYHHSATSVINSWPVWLYLYPYLVLSLDIISSPNASVNPYNFDWTLIEFVRCHVLFITAFYFKYLSVKERKLLFTESQQKEIHIFLFFQKVWDLNIVVNFSPPSTEGADRAGRILSFTLTHINWALGVGVGARDTKISRTKTFSLGWVRQTHKQIMSIYVEKLG